MRLTAEILERAYDFLSATPPFDKWNLPYAEDVDFYVLKGRSNYGDCGKNEHSGRHFIRVSERMHERYLSVLATVGHEMIHLHLSELVCTTKHKRLRTDNDTHGKAFRAVAAKVLKAHPDFDPVTF